MLRICANYQILLCYFMVGCTSIAGSQPDVFFNKEAFVGLESAEIQNYESSTLNYELTSKEGATLKFSDCLQVESTPEEKILTSEYGLYKLLLLNCQALKLFIEEGVMARETFFPASLTRELVKNFPATAVPQLIDAANVEKEEITLGEKENELAITIIDQNRAEVETSLDYINYWIMSRADFNNDGIEDLLVRMNWHVRDAFGKGSDLFILEKKSRSGPIVMTWRN